MKKLQEKLNFLLEKYPTGKTVTLTGATSAELDGVKVPLLPARYERRFIEMRKIVTGGTLCGVSVMRTSRTVAKSADVMKELYREVDIASFVLGRRPLTAMAFDNGKMLNAVFCFEDAVIFTLEIAATLAEGETPKDKHEVLAERGTACDVVVDAQLKQNSIYVFGEKNEAYTDVDFELYGLSVDECATVRAAYAMCDDAARAETVAADEIASRAVAAVKAALKNHRRENI